MTYDHATGVCFAILALVLIAWVIRLCRQRRKALDRPPFSDWRDGK